MPWHRHAAWMVKLDQLLEVALQWASGGKSSYRATQFKDWMPGDYAGEVQKRKKLTLKDQLRVVARVFGGNYGSD